MPAQRKISRYGWIRDLPDLRDARLEVAAITSLPSSADLSTSPHMPAVYDQGQLGSCTGNAIAAAVDFDNHRQTSKFLDPSRLWIYYQERLIEGTVAQDSGGQIRDGVKSVAQLGVCPESDWPYVISTFAQAPPQQDYTAALQDRALTYQAPPQVLWPLKSVLSRRYADRFRVHCLQRFRVSAGRADRHRSHAVAKRQGARRPRGDAGWLRRCGRQIPGQEFVGTGVGSERVLRNPLSVRHLRFAGVRLLGDPDHRRLLTDRATADPGGVGCG